MENETEYQEPKQHRMLQFFNYDHLESDLHTLANYFLGIANAVVDSSEINEKDKIRKLKSLIEMRTDILLPLAK